MKNFFYRVKEKDDVLSLSRKFNQCVFNVIADNNLKKEIECGDVLIFRQDEEKPNFYSLSPLEDYQMVAQKFNLSLAELKEKNGNAPYVIFGVDVIV